MRACVRDSECVCVCVCVCVCILCECERVCVCVCVCERERERESARVCVRVSLSESHQARVWFRGTKVLMKFLSRLIILLMKDRVPLSRECEKHMSIIVYMYVLMYMIGLLVWLGLISVSHKLVQRLKLKQSSGLVVLDQYVSLWSSLVYFCHRSKRFCWV